MQLTDDTIDAVVLIATKHVSDPEIRLQTDKEIRALLSASKPAAVQCDFDLSLAATDAHDPQSFINGARWALSSAAASAQSEETATCPTCGQNCAAPAQSAEPVAIVRDNPDDIGTVIEATRPLEVGTQLYLAAPQPAQAAQPVEQTRALTVSRDEARYRWWRNWVFRCGMDGLPTATYLADVECPEDIDFAIDAAITAGLTAARPASGETET